ncbi:MAG: hypothetical protein IJ575_06465 [Selenomonadaceae bacterium]|nr:hypothetical protein [Selenomonadaceae bacterium]
MRYLFTAILAMFMAFGDISTIQAAEGDMSFVRVTDIGAENFSRNLQFIATDINVHFDEIKRTPQFDSVDDNMSSWLTSFTVDGESGFVFFLVNADGYIQTIGISSDYIPLATLYAVEDIVLNCIGLTDSERQQLFDSLDDVRSAFCQFSNRRIWVASGDDGTVAIIATER